MPVPNRVYVVRREGVGTLKTFSTMENAIAYKLRQRKADRDKYSITQYRPLPSDRRSVGCTPKECTLSDLRTKTLKNQLQRK